MLRCEKLPWDLQTPGFKVLVFLYCYTSRMVPSCLKHFKSSLTMEWNWNNSHDMHYWKLLCEGSVAEMAALSQLWFAYCTGRTNVCLPLSMVQTVSLDTKILWDFQAIVCGQVGQRSLYSKALILLFWDLIVPLTLTGIKPFLFVLFNGWFNQLFIKKEATWLWFLVINTEWTSNILYLFTGALQAAYFGDRKHFITNTHPSITDNLKWSYLN